MCYLIFDNSFNEEIVLTNNKGTVLFRNCQKLKIVYKGKNIPNIFFQDCNEISFESDYFDFTAKYMVGLRIIGDTCVYVDNFLGSYYFKNKSIGIRFEFNNSFVRCVGNTIQNIVVNGGCLYDGFTKKRIL